MTKIAPALLEDWLREHYFTAEIDMSSSGVEDFSLAQLREQLGITPADLDQIFFHDSQTLGGSALREAIAQRWGNGDATQVMATNGSSESIFLLMHALLQAEDEVVVVEPCYPALVHIAESIGCQVKRWHLRFDQQFIPDLEELKRLVSPQTRMIVVNFPHNPTGASLTPEQQTELIRIVAATGAYLIWDAVFAEITYGSNPLPDARLLYERAVSIGTLSKAYGLPGLRVGWCLAPSEVLERCMHWRDYTTICLSPLVEYIAQRFIEQADDFFNLRFQQAKTNLNLLTEWMEQHSTEVQWVPPKGGVAVFPKLLHVENTEIFCRTLMEQQGVLLAPGTCFQHPSHVRLGFGTSTHHFQEGLRRLARWLQQ
jgi:capreomycidine synthase